MRAPTADVRTWPQGASRSPYDDWTVDELKKRAKEIGLSGYSSKRKADLISDCVTTEPVNDPSLWLDRPRPASSPPLPDGSRFDTVVVGADRPDCVPALELSRAGPRWRSSRVAVPVR